MRASLAIPVTAARQGQAMSHSQRSGFLQFALVTLGLYLGVVAVGSLLGRTAQSRQTHYTYLAESFLEGRLDVDPVRAPWLTELVSYEGKSYVVYPPMPAVVLMPLVALFGPELPMSAVSILLASLCVGLTYVLLRRAGCSAAVSGWVTTVFGFGTSFWYTALKGSSWHFAHVVAMGCLLLALLEAFGRRRALLIGLCVGAATLSRLPTVLATPVFVYLATRGHRAKLRQALLVLVGLGLFLGVHLFYNWMRYHTIADAGYALLPGAIRRQATGLFDLRYLPRNAWLAFFQPPLLSAQFPYLIPASSGLALFLASPALLLMFRAPWDHLTRVAGVAAALVALPSLLYGLGVHKMQFGFRYSLDYMPFLLLLVAQGMRGTVSGRMKTLVVLNCVIGLWGLAFTSPVEPPWLPMLDAYGVGP